MKTIDHKGFCDEVNKVAQRSKDEVYSEGLRRAVSIEKRFIRPTDLEKRIKAIVFNTDGHTDLDTATWQVLQTLPRQGIYDLLFGDDEQLMSVHKENK